MEHISDNDGVREPATKLLGAFVASRMIDFGRRCSPVERNDLMSFVSVIPECALPMFRVLARSGEADERLWATDVLLRAFDSAPDEVRPIWVDLVNDTDDRVRGRAAAYLRDLYKRSDVDPNWAGWD